MAAAPGAIAAMAVHALPPLLRRRRSSGRHLGLYWPLPGEADLLSSAAAFAGDTPIALPATTAGGAMVYRPWRPGMALEPDASGIPAPGDAAIPLAAGDLALLLVPALAFDDRAHRLGYGGGFYDRLRRHSDWRRVPALVVAPEICHLGRLPVDPWDVPFDGWLTDRGWRWRAHLVSSC
jgi:5-formyltetrahydrofolate cyclo-ligase